jgi:spermidine synthase
VNATAIGDARELVAGKLSMRVDAVIANVLPDSGEAVEETIRHAPRLLRDGGALIIQAAHPHFAGGDEPYRDGWREGSPAWYFRTVESWVKLLTGAGLDLEKVVEPVHPDTGLPASIIFVASLRG